MLMFAIISLILISIAYGILNQRKIYPVVILMVSIALLFHRSLISSYLVGWDIHKAYYFSKVLMRDGAWNSASFINYGSSLSTSILPSIYSHFLDLELTWIFKIVYPLFYSLVPIGLYRIFQRQFDEKFVLLSCFFFISIFPFFTEMLGLAKQIIGELFLVLLIMQITDKKIKAVYKAFFTIIFGFALVVSHYGIAYIYTFGLIFGYFIILAMNRLRYDRENKHKNFSITSILFFAVVALAWYLYTAGGYNFFYLVSFVNHIINVIFTDFLNPENYFTLNIITSKTTFSINQFTKIIHLIAQFFIFTGIIRKIVSRRDNVNKYLALSISFFLLLLAGLFVPQFTGIGSMGISRLYHVSLTLLASFFVLGGIFCFKSLLKIFNYPRRSINQTAFKLLTFFLVIFFLFNTGFANELIDPNQNIRVPLVIAR